MTMVRSAALVAAGAGLALAAVWGWQAQHPHLAAPVPQADAEEARIDPLALDAAQRQRLGITTGKLAAAHDEAGATGFARALDIGPLAAIDSEIQTAAAAATASAAEAARLRALARQDQSASARSVQLAEAQATADRLRTDLAQRRVALEFGPGLARLGAAARAALIADIANGRAALLRVDMPGTDLPAAAAMRIRIGDPPVAAQILGPAAAADARVQGQSLLVVLRGPAVRDAAAGRLLPARIADGQPEAGVVVPKAAVVRANGQLWVFVPSGAGFERRAIDAARPVAAGWFTPSGVRAGDTIVTAGAGALLGIENGPAAAESD